jgi:hypothetical protein
MRAAPYGPSWPTGAIHLERHSLTGAEALWIFPWENILVSSMLSRVAVVLGLVRFGARKVGLGFFGFPA